MQTQTHFLITAALSQLGQRRTARTLHTPALLIGSVLPDVPLALLTLLYSAYYRWVAPRDPGVDVHDLLHLSLFYTDPVWIIGHNTLHSLVITGLLALTGAFAGRQGRRWGWVLLWFALGAGFHTAIDIVTHHSDGPLFLFPLSWSYRFASPFSYWEPAYYGTTVRLIEYALSTISVLYLIVNWFTRRRDRNQLSAQPNRHNSG